MESFLVRSSSPNASSIFTTTGGNLLRRTHRAKNIYTSSYAPKDSQYKKDTQNKYNILKFYQPCLSNHYKCSEGHSSNPECNRKYIVKASIGQSFDLEPNAFDPKNILHHVKKFLIALYRFSYPYAFVGLILRATSASLLPVENLLDMSPLFFTSMLKAIVPFLFMGIYVSGVNQLFDIEIDKINKPYLPLSSGELSFTAGVIIVTFCLIVSFWLVWTIGSWPLIWSLLAYFVLGTAYSANVPLLRWKRHPVLAAMFFVPTWAFIFPISFFIHMQTSVFKRAILFSRPLIFVMIFMSFYTVGLALCKDIPDIKGDKEFGIDSFAVRFGPKLAFWICVSLFEVAFGIAILMGATSSCMWSKVVTGLGHVVLASILWYNAKSVDLTSKASITSFYMLIWKLLYAEYFMMPLVR